MRTLPKPDTQAGRLLQALMEGPVCSQGFWFDARLSHRLAARVFDLREAGFGVWSRKCVRHSHVSAALEYYLAEEE